MFKAGRITKAEFVFHCGAPIIWLHEHYWTKGKYDDLLGAITTRMDKIERKYGLKPDEHWLVGDAPPEYAAENEKYTAILEQKEIELFREVAPPELLDLRINHPSNFKEMYERGRRSVFEESDHVAAVVDLIELYESDAKKSETCGAYYAATTMLGSASEARILLECLKRPAKIRSILRKLPSSKRPKSRNPLTWTLENLIEVASLADWLPNIEDNEIQHIVPVWLHRLRGIRNLLHPGRHATDKPHVRLGEEEWNDASAAYVALCRSLENSRKKSKGQYPR